MLTLRRRKILMKLSTVREQARSSRRRTIMLEPTMVCADLTAVIKAYHPCVMELRLNIMFLVATFVVSFRTLL